MHYLSSSSSESEVFMTTKQRDMEQYGYERGFTVHDELTQSMASSSSESALIHQLVSRLSPMLNILILLLLYMKAEMMTH